MTAKKKSRTVSDKKNVQKMDLPLDDQYFHKQGSRLSLKANYIDLQEEKICCEKAAVTRVDCHAQVLVVDDNDFNLVTMPRILYSKYKFKKCDVARDGLTAIELCRKAIEERREDCECH